MEPLPETCSYCGFSSTYPCSNEADVKTCENRDIAYRNAERNRKYREASHAKRDFVQDTVAKLDAKIAKGVTRVTLSADDWKQLRSEFKSAWQY